MKKILTVLLALSVVFTYTVGTAFAADKMYYATDYATALNAEKATQLGYLESDLNQVVNGFAYDDNGEYNGYAKAAYEAAADDVLDTFSSLMDTAIRTEVDNIPAEGIAAAPSTVFDKLTSVVYEKTTGTWEKKKFSEILANSNYQKDVITENTDVLDKTQADISKADLEAAIADIDMSQYSTDTAKYDEDGPASGTDATMTAAEYVAYLIDQAEKAISDAEDKSDADKVAAYKQAKQDLENKLEAVKTIDEEQQDQEDAYKTVEAALAAMKAYATGDFYENNKLAVPASGKTVALTNFFKSEDAFYTAKTSSKNATVFGVEVADVEKVTRSEAIAINNAFYDAANASIDVARVYAGSDVAKVTALFNEGQLDGTTAVYTNTLANAVSIADKYAEVVEYGEDLKAIYELGVKIYDDAKVDEAVEAAEELVYADLGSTLKSAEDYLKAAANKLYDNTKGLANLEANVTEYDKLMEAIDEAKAKFNGSIINYGSNATPEEDKVFKADYYASEAQSDYAAIKADCFTKLDAAQSYDDIEAILADAKTELAGLLTAEAESDVTAARTQYIKALAEYADEQFELVDQSQYTKGQFDDAEADGADLINAATTVDDVKAAYADAQDLFNDLKTDTELKALAAVVETLVAAIPYRADITVSDKAQIDAAREAYDEYVATPGAEETDLSVITTTTLRSVENRVSSLQRAELVEKLDAMMEKIDDIPAGDAGIQATIDLKDEANALYDEITEFNQYIADYNQNHNPDLTTTAISGRDFNTLADFVDADEGDVWSAETMDVLIEIVKAVNDTATAEEMKAALDRYEQLTDRQQYYINAGLGFSTINLLKNKLIDSVESLKVVKNHSTAGKGWIRIEWSTTGDDGAVQGYEIYKSTKKNSGYKYSFTTKNPENKWYKNTADLKKGTRYYYKVRAIIEIDGEKYTSDWSNKAYRIAK